MVTDKIKKSLEKATGIKNPSLEFSSHEGFGDYSSNIALRAGQSAQDLVDKLKKDKELLKVVEKIEVAGPGFINFWLSKDILLKNLAEAVSKGKKFGSSNVGSGKTVVVDYSSPNIAKRFSIGHLRSTIIGQALYNLYNFTGYKVVGDNHLGDWGTQFGVLIYMVEKDKLDPTKLTVEDWEKLYVQFHKDLDATPQLQGKARDAFKRLEEGDKSARAIWKAALKTSLKEYQKLYDLLGIKIDYALGESFYEPMLGSIIDEAKKANLVKKSQGAEIVELKGQVPAMLVKSDGATTYFTRDLATIKYRIKTWNPDIFIYEVGSDQTLYFRQLFGVARLLGWAKKRVFIHVAHGLVRFEHGKMSTRRGQTVKLEEVLDEALKRAKKYNPDPKISQMVGVGAVKYFDLMHEPSSDIVFDWDKIFVLEGNSGPYLQYTYARAQSVVNKAKGKVKESKTDINNEEFSVLRTLVRFPELISIATKNYSPNILCEYLFQLAQKYNNFYNTNRIIGSDNEKFRLNLTRGVGQVIKNGLNLLGIEAPEKM